ncbi:MAG: dihydrodipicolinate synthase family protein [Zestosphaera sp.]
MFEVKGIMTALITPFRAGTELCVECLESMIRFQEENGIAGLYISGTYGEGVITPLDVRETLFRKTIEVAPSKITLLPHVGGADIETIIRLAKLAKDLGYPAVSVVGPLYHVPTRPGLVKFFGHIAKTDIPIVIYNNKGRQGYNISPEDFDAIVKEVPHIVGIKDASYDVEQLLEYVIRFGSRRFIAGAGDSLLLYTFVVGAPAHICGISNVLPEIAIDLYKAVTVGDLRKAAELQYKVIKLRKMIKGFGVETQEVLRAMLKLRGVDSGEPPMQLSHTLTEKQISELKSILENYLKQ